MRESVAVAKEADRKQEFSPTNTVIHHVRDEHEMQLGSLGGVIGNIRRDGGKPSVESIATELASRSAAERAPALIALQQTHGNRYVQRVVSGIQAKLVVGQPGDVYEQEADRVAEEVMRMPEPRMQRQPVEEEMKEEELIQTKPIAEQITPFIQKQAEEEEELIQPKPLSQQITLLVQKQVEEEDQDYRASSPSCEQAGYSCIDRGCRRDGGECVLIDRGGMRVCVCRPRTRRASLPIQEEELLQAKSMGDVTPEVTLDLESQINTIRGGGKPLSEYERAFFEPRFGVDFGQVRLHSDARAAESAWAVNARAYTVGRDVVFGAGQYVPGTTEGQRLLAHELTHVMQQSQSRPTVKQTMSATSKIKQNNIFARKAKAHATRLPAGYTTSITHRQMKPSVFRIQRSTFAFYTMGDTRPLRGCPNLTRSDMYQAYARTVASQVFGVGTDGGALSQINSLQPNSVNRALFVGHGNSGDGDFFSGSPRGVNNFISSLPNMFDSGDINLMNALERVLVPQRANVEFHACYVGNSPLVGALQGILNTARYQTGNIVNIIAYTGMSVLRPNVQNCSITGFQAPPRGTTWQAGRMPRHP